ncbi:mucin-2 isoform X2 [Eurosta solidaginis]|uniref:mucin-2 isoform X2 n=1 Tax=Eurosta solidaginis TaxID=178769 RepID=UPI003530F108
MSTATSSILAAANASAVSSSATTLSGSSGAIGGNAPLISTTVAQFREIHKNTWLKRLTAEGKKFTVGPKKSDRSWVVFCVHDDTDALLEGYAEPRLAPSHIPEWTVSMQDTLHISHALIPNSHEFEFVVTLANEVIRFHAMSWEIMQEWVETLRSKLREMKILSPRENLYTKLPEIRAPLLPTRDPTSPLPAPPPVPAAIVPGVERVVPSSLVAQDNATQDMRQERSNSINSVTTTALTTLTQSAQTTTTITASSLCNNGIDRPNVSNLVPNAITNNGNTPMPTVTVSNTQLGALPALTSMSNTLTQNLLNMLSDPISAYSEQINDVSHMDDSASSIGDANDLDFDDAFLSPILRKSQRKQANLTSATNADKSVRVDIGQRASADQIKNWEHFVEEDGVTPTRLHTPRSLSAGAADSARRKITKPTNTNHVLANMTNDNITAFEIGTDTQCQPWQNVSQTSTISDTIEEQLDIDKMNITIIQVSTSDPNEQESETNPNKKSSTSSSSSSKLVMGDIFKFPDNISQSEYKSNVQIIPSTKTNSNTIQVLDTKANKATTIAKTQYTTPVKSLVATTTTTTSATTAHSTADELKITTVHVTGNTTTTAVTPAAIAPTTTGVNTLPSASASSLYGTCYTPTPSSSSTVRPIATNMSIVNGGGTPKMMKKIILSANSTGITNITVNNASHTCTSDTTVKHNIGSVHYEKVFLSTSAPPSNFDISVSTGMNAVPPISPNLINNSPISKRKTEASTKSANKSRNTCKPPSPIPPADGTQQDKPVAVARTVSPSTTININSVDMPSIPTKGTQPLKQSPLMSRSHTPAHASPVPDRRRIPTATNLHILATATTSSTPQLAKSTSSTTAPTTASTALAIPSRAHLLKRGLTEAVITTRPSRRDFHLLKAGNTGKGKTALSASNKNSTTTTTVTLNNNTTDNPTITQQTANTPNASTSSNVPPNISRNRNCELLEQRRRSSSTSDARTGSAARGANNNELPTGRNVAALRFQQPPQPLRNSENVSLNGGGSGSGNGSSAAAPPASSGANNSPASMRLTLREHQVMQLRREIMHPGGVRLQLRRKDCVGSIAWVDAFGAVWVAGWKQKEHPMLYNALHIGDQLLSIAGTNITCANEANKIIRNSNTLFVEMLVRRIPFGRGYAIRREREGQCLGLIRDGNTATIVDVVPNSLAARHGLPPKLTVMVLLIDDYTKRASLG